MANGAMTKTDQPIPERTVRIFRRAARAAGATAVALGMAALTGWLTGWGVLARIGTTYIPMAPNTALAFVGLGLTLWPLSGPETSRAARRIAGAVAGLVAAVATLRLYELAAVVRLGTDRWFLALPRQDAGLVPLGEVSYPTAATLFCASAGVLSLALGRRERPVVLSGLATLTVGTMFTLGYLFGAPFFYGEPAIPMALSTALGLAALGAGVLAAAGPQAQPLRQLCGPSVYARLLRAFLPFTVAAIAAAAWLVYYVGNREGPGSAAFVCGVVVPGVVLLVILVCARIAHLVGADLGRAEAELRGLNRSLERRVAERTEVLEERRDRLEQYFSLITSLQDPGHAEKTFELVLHFCRRLGYDQAMLSLVDPEARVIRAVKTAGMPDEMMQLTVRDLDGPDILAVVAREGKPVVIPDSTQDPRCDPKAVAAGEIRGQVVLPLVSGEVIGTLQVISRSVLNPSPDALRQLETLGMEAAQALASMRQVEKIQRLNRQLQDSNAVLRKLADELGESEARFRAVSQSANDAIVSADAEGLIIHWNKGAEAIFGYRADEVLGKPLTLLMPERHRAAHARGLEHARQTGELRLIGQTVELEGRRKDGCEFPLDLSLSAWDTRQGTFYSGIIRDITSRKRAQEQLRLRQLQLEEAVESERRAHHALKQAQSQLVQTEKLAALGQLVAGVAHEINNPLSFVSNNVAVLQRDVRSVRDVLAVYRAADGLLAEHRPELHARLTELDQAVDLAYTLEHLDELAAKSRDGLKRIQQIVKDLRDFARLDESDLQEADVVAGIESTLHIIQSRAKKQGVELRPELAPLPPVTCYPAKVNQVVLNLVANAIDACKAGDSVTVRTAARDGRVEIHVIDTGQGIDPAVRERVFDPFFTTKPLGQGTGLGLSISYQIVQDHGGAITFESEKGKGTHFVVSLPLKAAVAGPPRGR